MKNARLVVAMLVVCAVLMCCTGCILIQVDKKTHVPRPSPAPEKTAPAQPEESSSTAPGTRAS